MKNRTKRSARAVVGLLGALTVALALVGAASADHDPDYNGTANSHFTSDGIVRCAANEIARDVAPVSGLVKDKDGDEVIQLTISADGTTAAWAFTPLGADKWDMAAVLVKAGNQTVTFVYDSGTTNLDDSDSGLRGALVGNGERPEISHLDFCADPKDAGGTADLAVEKTAEASWTQQRGGWNVEKSGALTTAPSKSGNGQITWDVEWTKGANVDTYVVSGQITISNDGTAAALNVTVDDTLDGDPDFVLDCGEWEPGDNLAAGAEVVCSYSVELDGAVNGTNEVTVDAANADEASASAEYTFPETPTLVGDGDGPDTVYVVDDRFEFSELVETGGSTQFTEPVGCAGGTFTNTVELREPGEGPGKVIDSDTAQVVVPAVDCSTTPPPTVSQTPQIDVQVIKDATPQLTLGASGTAEITYNVVVKNNGPNTANDVVFADAAPSGVEFVAGTLTQAPVITGGVPCSLTASVLSCTNLGDFGPGVQTALSWKATVRTAGTFVNTGTATGTGTDTNPGNNTDDATTVVVAPPVVQPPVVQPPVAKPPVAKPKPKPAAICLKLAVRGTKMVSQGQRSAVAFKVTKAGKPVAGAAVVLRGAGIYRIVKTNKQGLAIAGVTPAKAGIVTATLSPKQVGCNSARVGVVGVFEPPVTG